MPRVGEAMPVGEDVEAHLGEFGVAVGLLWSMLLVGFTGGVFFSEHDAAGACIPGEAATIS